MSKGRGGLGKWFSQNWVDIGRPKKGGGFHKCGRKKAKKGRKGYPKCVPASKAASMSKAQIKSAVRRKRSKKITSSCSARSWLDGNRRRCFRYCPRTARQGAASPVSFLARKNHRRVQEVQTHRRVQKSDTLHKRGWQRPSEIDSNSLCFDGFPN